ncbi:MAG: ATP-binding protein [Acidobacteriota bacterium]
MRSRFLWKLFAGYAFLILVATGLVGVLVAQKVESETVEETDRRLRASAILLSDLVAESLRDEDAVPALQARVRELGEALEIRITVVRLDGRVIVDSEAQPELMDDHSGRPEFVDAAVGGLGVSTRFSKTLQERRRYLALPLDVDGERFGFVRTSVPLTVLNLRLAELRQAVFLGSLIAIVLALGVGFLYARQVTRPLLSMAEAASEIAAGDYDHRVEAASHDELGKLALAFNTMSREVRASVAAMAADREKLAAILGSMTEGVVAVDRDERVVHINSVAARLLHTDPERLLSHPIWEVTRLHEVSRALGDCLETQQRVDREIRFPGAPDRILRLSVSPLRTRDELAGAVVLLDDITQLRHLETMRRDFVANVSHELKTPITAIRGLVETLLDDPAADPAMRHRFLERVLRQAERMANLVIDLLSLSRLESGSRVLEMQTLDLRHPIRESVRTLGTAAASRRVELTVELTDAPVLVEGEDEALRQAVSNLIDNAIKYSPEGGTVQVRLLLREGAGEAVVEVEDHGIGIEPRDIERLFERFYRVDKARSQALGGTGLGLAIVKHIALALGGLVTVDSAPGRGSTFRLHFPYPSSPE